MRVKRWDTRNIGTGFLYFYVHFVTEVICFFVLGNYVESVPVTWLIVFAYDMLAFVPQSVIGYINDKFRRISFSCLGLPLLAVAVVMQRYTARTFLSLVILCLGNALIHVNGAEVTLRTSNGNLSHSAIFVSGGSFGVITGKLLSAGAAPFWLPLILIASAVPFAVLAQMYLDTDTDVCASSCRAFRYVNPGIGKYTVIALSLIVVITRGYMAYGIPTSWIKTTLQTVLLFCSMGMGKALGGILSDLFGIRRVALSSVLLALPLLLFGDKNMYISLIGVLFFSMTMSITLALLVSVLPESPGLAFGLTTIGLFLGTAPVFFIKIPDFALNSIMLSAATAICFACLFISIRKGDDDERPDRNR